ncbi:MAG TPA: cell division protein FtsL [Candidatus Binatia bacterium]|nr:cell division protein FtsL [Candidatus Binatia bacterium]
MAIARRSQAAQLSPLKKPRVDRVARWERRRRVLHHSLAFLCLASVALLYVWLRLQVLNQGYALSATTKLQQRLEQEQRELKLELATLTSPERVEAMARQRLGLRPPEKGQVIVLP